MVLGCRLMCACALAGAIHAPATSSGAILLMFMSAMSSWWVAWMAARWCVRRSPNRHLHGVAVLFEFRDPVGYFDFPGAAGAQLGRAEDVVAGSRQVGLQRQRADALGGQLGGGGQFLGGRELGAGLGVDQVQVDRVQAHA